MKALAAGLILSLTGCYNTVIHSGPAGQMMEEERTTFNFLWGITTADLDVTACPSGLSKVEVYTPWWNYILAPITIGIVSAHQTGYYCTHSPQLR